MRDFAQEIIDHVLDQVFEQDKADREGARNAARSITTCGLVCKQWLPRSRLHVFSRAVLRPARLQSLLDLEATSSLPLLSLFRRLTLLFDEYLVFQADNLANLRRCLNLTCLIIHTPFSGEENFRTWSLFLTTHLPVLGIHCVSLSRFELCPWKSKVSLRMIADIFACLPALEAFELENDSCRIVHADVPLSQAFPPRLNTLDITIKGGTDVLFAWFLSLAAPPSIKSLTLSEQIDPSGRSLVDYVLSEDGRCIRIA
ncbi:hypothetical protein B0H13DRAFT_2358391 [Mycena leptocephala]|nr:hypothetical protein B0H13DRAFT_2358391 [Mycena leptocephala]